MLEGLPYDFMTSDGTLYKGAVLVSEEPDGSVWIAFRDARVFIAAHELVGAA
jgi:hypothetical protein